MSPEMPRYIRTYLLRFILCAVCGTSTCAPIHAPTSDRAWWAQDPPTTRDTTARKQKVVRTSHFLTMRDGVRIAVDLYLPGDLVPGSTIPAIVLQTRYARAFDVKDAYRFVLKHRFQPTIERFVRSGYAWIIVDARGSGASFGTRSYPFGPDEIRDGAQIVDWIVEQHWSNGRVGAWGNSYDGTAALFLAATRHPAVKAIMPRFAYFDAYSEVVFPGGIHLRWLTETWGKLARALDRNVIHEFVGFRARLALEGLMPVDGDADRSLLLAATAEHMGNGDVRDLVRGVEYRDDESPAHPGLDLAHISPSSRLEDLNRADTAPYLYTGWFDAAFLLSEIHLYMNLDQPGKRLTIGPWEHGGWHNISPHAPDDRLHFDHPGEALRFFDHHLKGRDTGIRNEKPVHYYTMGEERWKASDSWPPPERVTRSYYLRKNGVLGLRPSPDTSGFDEYRVDRSAGTGSRSRWDALVNLDRLAIRYPNRARRDRKLLVYTSMPLTDDLEVTGHPQVSLNVASTHDDGLFFVYLEDVDDRGRVTYVTEGMLRAVHRRLSNDEPPYQTPVPYRSFRRADAAPLIPGEVTELKFDLYPTSYLFKKGHSIRIALAGADADHFANLPGTPATIRCFRDVDHPSHIELPVIPREGD